MDANLIGNIATAVSELGSSLVNGITGLFAVRAQTEAQVEMNRDNNLSDTNRSFAANSAWGGAAPVMALAVALAIMVLLKEKKH